MELYFHPASTRWLGKMKQLKSWKRVNAVINGYAATLKCNRMQAV
jgi:hypothetical protein